MNARDTQFAGFAKALYDKLYDQFSNLIVEEDGGEKYKAEQTRKGIQETIAESAYDLVDLAICHVAMGMSNDSAVMFVPRQNAVNYIPDMTELPKEQE